jgi:hypothetical protein
MPRSSHAQIGDRHPPQRRVAEKAVNHRFSARGLAKKFRPKDDGQKAVCPDTRETLSNMSDELKINDKTLSDLIASVQKIGHEAAAKGQIEQAIFLWFHKDDRHVVSEPAAIHTLAMAAQGVLWAYSHDARQRPSVVAQKIQAKGDPHRAQFVDALNFFKHGNVGRKEKGKRKAVGYLPDLTDLVLADDICTFNRLFMISSGLMDAFLLRFSLDNPRCGVRVETLEKKLFSEGYDLQTIARFDRKSFYDIVCPCAADNLREQRPPTKP